RGRGPGAIGVRDLSGVLHRPRLQPMHVTLMADRQLVERLRNFAQLVRLPNVFTALADIGLGALATGALPGNWLPFVLLLLASACLYCGGMVWNAYFDIEQDRRERPFRPLPSGRVTPREALLLGAGLLGGGFVLTAVAGLALGPGRLVAPVLIAG